MEKLASALVTLLLLGAVKQSSAMREGRNGGRSIMSVNLTIQNDLGGGINLNTHCQSGDDDLGVHNLANSQYIQWSFNNSWLGDTLYWCSMRWNNVQGKFNVYDYKRDFARCVDCWWSIRRDGAYCHRLTSDNKNITWQLLYVWKK